MSIVLLVVIFIVLMWALTKATLIVPEGTVVKTFFLGKAQKSYPAGLHLGWFDKAVERQIKLKIGTIAVASSTETIELDGIQIPAKFSETPDVGSPVRIEKFDGMDPVVTHRNVPNERLIKCEKCGHSNKVRV